MLAEAAEVEAVELALPPRLVLAGEEEELALPQQERFPLDRQPDRHEANKDSASGTTTGLERLEQPTSATTVNSQGIGPGIARDPRSEAVASMDWTTRTLR